MFFLLRAGSGGAHASAVSGAANSNAPHKANQDPNYLFLIQACKIGNLALLKSLMSSQHTTVK